MIKSVRVNILSKLTFTDSQKFDAIINDMFPNIKPEDIAYEDLHAAIKQTLQELNL